MPISLSRHDTNYGWNPRMSRQHIAIAGPSKHDRTSGQRARKRTTANIDFRGAVRASGAIAVAVGVAVSDSVAVDFQGRTCCERVKGGLAEAASQRSRSLSTETIKKWINLKKFDDYPRFTADITPGAKPVAPGRRPHAAPQSGSSRRRAGCDASRKSRIVAELF